MSVVDGQLYLEQQLEDAIGGMAPAVAYAINELIKDHFAEQPSAQSPATPTEETVMSTEPDLVYVEWVDSYGCSTEWRKIPDIIDDQPMVCRSVGWVVAIDQDKIVLVPHMSPDHEKAEKQGCGDMTIPSRAIRSIRLLTKQTGFSSEAYRTYRERVARASL